MDKRKEFVILAVLMTLLSIHPASATYEAPPFGHHDIRDIVIVDHTGDSRMAVGAQHAADLWNAVGANFHLTVIAGIISTSDAVCSDNSTPGRIHLCMDPTASYQGGFTNWTYELSSSTHLRAAFIRMCGQAPPSCYDFNDPSTVRRILPHEVGHALGLYHQSAINPGDTCSIMSVTCYSEVPSTEDVTTLRALYGHSDGVTTTTTTTTTTIISTTTSTVPATTSTTASTTTSTIPASTSTTLDPTCAMLAQQYSAYSGNPSAQAAIRQQQLARGCPI